MAKNEESSKKRPPNFRLEIPGDGEFKTKIQGKLQEVKTFLTSKRNAPVNNAVIIEELLEFWLKKHSEDQSIELNQTQFPSTYLQVRKKDVNQKMFVCAESSLLNICELCEAHTKNCNGKLKFLKKTMKGHVLSLRLQCSKEKMHSYSWSSSPYLPNDEYLVNHRICHGLMCSGMLPSHYTRFSNGSGLGCINWSRRKQFFELYKNSVEAEYKDSIQDSLHEEIGSYEDLDGINILTDARHGWRKNAKDTSVVAIGEKSHKILDCVHVTKQQDPVSQRHERIGTEAIYDNFTSQDVTIKIHSHDRNLSINKFIKDTEETTNQNDLWHSVKSLKKSLKNISSGSRKSEGFTWSEQLVDKTEPIATHIHWAVRHCEGNPKKLQEFIENIIPHYENSHEKCHPESRCRKDKNYEPSRVVLTSKIAKKLLENTLKGSVIYKYPEDYILGKDTFYVESFNNVMNIFQDKRIVFGVDQYKLRSNLAVCHWNENVDREHTSVYHSRNPNAPRNQKGKKVYKKLTFKYREKIWCKYIESFY